MKPMERMQPFDHSLFHHSTLTGLNLERSGRSGGTRTHDPLIKSQLLYRLSYTSTVNPACAGPGKKWSERRDSNPRQSPWQGDTLPTELRSHGKRATLYHFPLCIQYLFCWKHGFGRMSVPSGFSASSCNSTWKCSPPRHRGTEQPTPRLRQPGKRLLLDFFILEYQNQKIPQRLLKEEGRGRRGLECGCRAWQ